MTSPFPTIPVTPGTGGLVNTLPPAGQTTSDSSLPVVLASDHSPVAVAPNGLGYSPSGVSAVTTTFTAVGRSASFTPLSGRGFNISLWGTFVAAIQLERSFDGGTNWLPLTAGGIQLFNWSAPASEVAQEDQNGVLYSLHCTSFTSGPVSYRLSQ
jgi:hypothetical protein